MEMSESSDRFTVATRVLATRAFRDLKSRNVKALHLAEAAPINVKQTLEITKASNAGYYRAKKSKEYGIDPGHNGNPQAMNQEARNLFDQYMESLHNNYIFPSAPEIRELVCFPFLIDSLIVCLRLKDLSLGKIGRQENSRFCQKVGDTIMFTSIPT